MAIAMPPRGEEGAVRGARPRVSRPADPLQTRQIALLVGIKNALTPAQQAKLEEIARNGK